MSLFCVRVLVRSPSLDALVLLAEFLQVSQIVLMTLPLDNRLIIRTLRPDDSFDELTELLHRAYRVLADMGLRFLATHQDVDTTRSRVATGTCFVAELDGKIIGTITYYAPGRRYGCDYYKKKGVAHIGQLAVEPTVQRLGVAARLMSHAEEFARSRVMRELALDTAEPAIQLIDWYTRIGYRFVGYHQWDVTNYRSVIMSKLLIDSKI